MPTQDCTIENGALQIVPQSHGAAINATGDQLSADERFAHAPAERRRFVLLKKGEAIVLHNWCLHRSEVNPTLSYHSIITLLISCAVWCIKR